MEADGLFDPGREFIDDPLQIARVYFFFSDYNGKKFINGLQIEGRDGTRGSRHSRVQDKCPYSVLELSPNERITQIEGYVEDPEGLVYLEFWTKNNPDRKVQPIHIGGQSEDGTSFTRMILPEGHTVVGFHGTFGKHIKSLGMFVAEPEGKKKRLDAKSTTSMTQTTSSTSSEPDDTLALQGDPTLDLNKVEKTTHYGCLDGNEFKDPPLRIKRVMMYIEGKMIVGIQVASRCGKLTSVHGKSKGPKVGVSQLVLGDEEYITQISGGATDDGLVWIRFTVKEGVGATTEVVKHFGGTRDDDDSDFSMYIKGGNVVVGFHGTKTSELKSLGVLHYPNSLL